MELPRDGDHRHILHLADAQGGNRAFVVRLFHPDPREESPRTGTRYDLDGVYVSKTDAYAAAAQLVRKINAGEATAKEESLSETVGQYRVLAGVAFRADRLLWEPTLSIKSRKPENKGAVQEFNSSQSALRINLFPESAAAAKFALEYGRRIIARQISGLKI